MGGWCLVGGIEDDLDQMLVDRPLMELADAVATALCNRIKKAQDVKKGLDWVKNITGILGALIIIEDQLGAWGEIELC